MKVNVENNKGGDFGSVKWTLESVCTDKNLRTS